MASKYDGAQIAVMNWDKYNPRTKGKRYSWFRVDNEMAQGPTLFGLNCEHKWLWIVILCHFSKRRCEPFTWNCAFFEAITGINAKTQEQALEFFNKNGLISSKLARTRTRSHELAQTSALRDEHNEHNEQDETNTPDAQARADFDLESAYRRFPKKEGKSKGLKKLKSEIRSQEDFEKLIVSIENYATSRRGQDPKFTKHFSTFVSEWRDWIDYKPDEAIARPQNAAYRRMEGNALALQQALASIGVDDEQAG